MFLNKFYIIVLIILLPTLSFALEDPAVTVDGMVFCTAIKNRNPIGADTSFSSSVGRVYCFTKLSSVMDTTSISHVWYYNNTQVAIVDLNVNAKSWRTWSSKRIIEEWIGTWRVDVTSSVGGLICSQEFLVRSNSE